MNYVMKYFFFPVYFSLNPEKYFENSCFYPKLFQLSQIVELVYQVVEVFFWKEILTMRGAEAKLVW